MADRTLHIFAPAPGEASASPFSTKAMILLAMAGLDYDTKVGDPTKAPKKKLPVLIDGTETIPDSGFIRRHLETRYGVDLDAGLDARERAVATAMIALAEDRLYFAGLAERWVHADNHKPLVAMMRRSGVPGPLSGIVTNVVRRTIRRTLHGQGHGRHSREEGLVIGREAIDAIAAQLGERAFVMGDEPTSADASVFPMLVSNVTQTFDTRMRPFVEAHANLAAYMDRMRERFRLPLG